MAKTTPRTFQPLAVERQHELTGTQLANFAPRAAAFLLDLMAVRLLVLVAGLIIQLYGIMARQPTITLDENPFHGWALIALVLYFAVALYWGKGQTIGKRLLRIRVVSLVHHRMSFWHCVERTLGYGASLLEGGFGFIQFFIHPNRQTAHDRLSETIVIREPRPEQVIDTTDEDEKQGIKDEG
ncbi:MAG: RDD family protein [Calditrichota bacterium]